MQSGVCCWVSYIKTASCVATAYTILYGSENAEFVGVPDEDGESEPPDCDPGVEVGSWAATAGGGNNGIESISDDVSTVMCLVVAGAFRYV